MDQNKKSSTNNQLICKVCKINFISQADFALHEFSKKHCDNLLKMMKRKPGISKPKVKTKTATPGEETQQVNKVTHVVSFSKYGYFVPGRVYGNAEVCKEFNTDYDPYMQKFAKNSCVEKNTYSSQIDKADQMLPVTANNINFSRKKKKQIKTCQICNVTFTAIPDYEAHVKSSQHIWKLKVSGVGVSAHFVKASTELCTTDVNDYAKLKNEAIKELSVETVKETTHQTSGSFPIMYCSDCELLLNSVQQYNAHVAGKSHIECTKKKSELEEKVCSPTPDRLYCYSCKIYLNNFFQYNEHKNGKKHRSKCKQLIKNGITIPPEERISDLNILNPNKAVVYPDLYEKTVLSNKIKSELKENGNSKSLVEPKVQVDLSANSACSVKISFKENSNNSSPIYFCNICKLDFKTLSSYTSHCQNENCANQFLVNKDYKENFSQPCISSTLSETIIAEESKVPNEKKLILISQNKSAEPLFGVKEIKDNVNITEVNFSNETTGSSNLQSKNESLTFSLNSKALEPKNNEKEFSDGLVVISDNKLLECSLCIQQFHGQSEYNSHLNSEDHFKQILDLKTAGKTNAEILKILFSDRNYLKRDDSGKLNCSFCNVITNNDSEFEQHIKSVVHKNALKDYKRKKINEVNFIVPANDVGLFMCSLCKEGWKSLVDFIQHLNFVKHRNIQNSERAKKVMAKKRIAILRRRKLTRSTKKNKPLTRCLKNEKNPGVRTKIGGVATDLSTGAQTPIPNLEPLEPKIDLTKNLNVGVNQTLDIKKVKKKPKINRTLNTLNGKHHRPFLDEGNVFSKETQPSIPPLLSNIPFYPQSQSFHPPHNYFLPTRHLLPYSNPYFRPRPFPPRLFFGKSYFEPPWPQ